MQNMRIRGHVRKTKEMEAEMMRNNARYFVLFHFLSFFLNRIFRNSLKKIVNITFFTEIFLKTRKLIQ